ncbi:MAG: hypothetical protein Kilf2KO_30740 [Rhodospirillales bacterium]
MQAAPPIRQAADITLAWLTQALGEAGLLSGGRKLLGFETEGLSTGDRGFLSGVVRIQLNFDPVPQDANPPRSVIVKMPPESDERLTLGIGFNAYMREARFYEEIAGDLQVRVPKCYHISKDEARGTSVLVMEDATDWRPADQVYGLSLDQVEATLDTIADLHARWWRSPKLEDLDWIATEPWDHGGLFEERWRGFLEAYRHWLSPEGLHIGETLAASGPAMLRALKRPPRTLVHCDVRADNLLVDGPRDGDRVMVLDWQLLSRTMAALDPARLVCGSLETALPESGYRAMAMRWHGRLQALGVSDYSAEEAWRDFRIGILSALYIPVCFHSVLSHEGGRAIRLLEAQAHRMFRAAAECRSLEALDGS